MKMILVSAALSAMTAGAAPVVTDGKPVAAVRIGEHPTLAHAAQHPELIASESELMRTGAALSGREEFQIRDPFVLAENGTYYLYKTLVTTNGCGVGVATSKDLERWTEFAPSRGAHVPCASLTGPRKIRKVVIKVRADE